MRRLRAKKQTWVSSREIARSLKLTSSTVRQDLTHLDFFGIPKQGYRTLLLERTLSSILERNKKNRLVIVGAGSLGRALALHDEFRERGFAVRAIVDSDPGLIGRRVGGLVVEDMTDLTLVVKAEGVDIGVVVVPAEQAQHAANQLILSGVGGLLNLSPAHVASPGRVPVVDVRIADSLKELAYSMTSRRA